MFQSPPLRPESAGRPLVCWYSAVKMAKLSLTAQALLSDRMADFLAQNSR